MKYKPFSPRVWIAGSACLLLLLACSLFSGPTPTPEPPPPTAPPVEVQPVETEPPPTEAPQPVETEAPIATEEPPATETPSCYKWDQITTDMEGEVVCVYGKAFSHQGQSRIDFSPEKNSFFLIDSVYYYPNLSDGVCVVAQERVEVFENKIPFMTIKEGLYECDPWMLE